MTVTLRNVPSELLDILRESAKISRRSLNSEIIIQLEKAISSNRSERLKEFQGIENDLAFQNDLQEIKDDYEAVDSEKWD